MTLNILATSRHAVYLTGDFRLTIGDRPAPDDFNVQRLIPVVKLGWCGIVAHSGIGRTPSGLDVGAWLGGQVREERQNESIAAFHERLMSAERWLANVPQRFRYLTIAMTEFIQRHPSSAVITNCEAAAGTPLPDTLPRLVAYKRKPKTPEVRALGSGATSIRKEELARLSDLLTRHDPAAFEGELSQLNDLVAARNESVSAQCVVGRMDAGGNGAVRPMSIDFSGGHMPDFVRRQAAAAGILGFETKFDSEGKALPQAWIGMTIKRTGVVGQGAIAGVMHAFRNVGPAIEHRPPAE